MAEIIRHIIISMHGAFLPKEHIYLDESMREFKEHVYSSIEMDHHGKDKVNMCEDVQNLRNDFKKSVKLYKEESVL